MDTVREWAYSLCCVCVIGGILSMLSPEGGSKKSLGMIISLMALLVAFRPLASLRELPPKLMNHASDASRYENPALEEEVRNRAERVYSSYLRQNLSRVLDGAGINYKCVNVQMDKSADGCISIGQVEVIVQNEDVDQSDRIKRLLRDYIGFDPAVTKYDEKGSDRSE